MKEHRIKTISTLSLTQKWLREAHRIHIKIEPYIDMDRYYHYWYVLAQEVILDENKTPYIKHLEDGGYPGVWRVVKDLPHKTRSFSTYEKALEAGIEEALTLI